MSSLQHATGLRVNRMQLSGARMQLKVRVRCYLPLSQRQLLLPAVHRV